MNQTLINLRQELHQHPELSNQEFKTSKTITDFILQYNPDEIVSLGKTGKAFVFDSKIEGETLMFRSELDAVPISEQNNLPYTSNHDGVAHSCGHDGHMVILAGLTQLIAKNRPESGRVVLLFQPAEECEQGAFDVVNHPNFKPIEPDYIFALHNIPGKAKNTILLKEGSFTAASKGMTIKLYGKVSHAAEPENGLSPANAIAKIIQQLHALRENKSLFADLALLTIIHINMGEIAFGKNPGYAEIRITLRSIENKDMKLLCKYTEDIINKITKEEGLTNTIEYCEIFPATENHPKCCEMVERAAKENKLSVKNMEQSYRWSEDFAYFTEKYKGTLFGLGAGIDQPALHHANYDFPDDIIESGVKVFYHIYSSINRVSNEQNQE